MPVARRRVPLRVERLDERITPDADPVAVDTWVRSLQLHGGAADGALLTNQNSTREIDPYFSGYAVRQLLAAGVSPQLDLQTAAAQLRWHLRAITTPGVPIQRITYDASGAVLSARSADADDSSPAIFFDLAWQYVRRGGDRGLFAESGVRAKIDGMVAILRGLQEADGLTVATATYRVKYLADNSEVYAGLVAAARLMAEVYADPAAAAACDALAERVRTGINTRLYSASTGLYLTSIDNGGNPNPPTAAQWYPSALITWPAQTGVIDPSGVVAAAQMSYLDANWSGQPGHNSNWVNTVVAPEPPPYAPDGYLWPSVGYTARLAGDDTRGLAHADWVYAQRFAADPQHPAGLITSADGGFLLRALLPLNHMPTAAPTTGTTPEEVPTTVTLAGTDGDGDTIHYTVVGPPAHGTLRSRAADPNRLTYLADPRLDYTPAPGFVGTDTFAVRVSDGEWDSLPVTVSVTVTGPAVLATGSSVVPVFAPDVPFGPRPNASPNDAYVKGLYRTVLGRDADAGGLAAWTVRLANGLAPQAAADAFWNSPEHRGRQVDEYYRVFLGRAADPAGRASWVNLLQSGRLDEAGAAREFLLSGEVQGRAATSAGFVGLLYRTVLGREPDADGQAAWVGLLDAGRLTRRQAADLFIGSGESHERMVRSFYRAYLQRAAADAEVAGWRGLLDAGAVSPAGAAVLFLSGAEFRAAAGRAVG